MTILIFLVIIFTGLLVQNRLSKVSVKDLFYALPIGTVLLCALVYILALILGLNYAFKIVLIVYFLFGLFYLYKSKNLKISFKKEDRAALLLSAFFIIPLLTLFDNAILSTDLQGNLMTADGTYGDLPFHLSTIMQMYAQDSVAIKHPVFASHDLVYPFFINLFSAGLVSIGVSVRNAILIPGMVLGTATVGILYYFYIALVKDVKTSLLATVVFFLFGGLGFIYFIKDIFLTGELSTFLQNPQPFTDFSHFFVENIQWSNYLTRIIVPERSVLLGIPIGLIILTMLFLKKEIKTRDIILAGILTGLMPFTHTHTFLAFSVMIPVIAFLQIIKDQNIKITQVIKKWLIYGSVTLVVALPQLLLLASVSLEGDTFFKYNLGWMSEPGGVGFLLFWLKNSGVMIPALLYVLFFEKGRLFKYFVISVLVVFVIINLFTFQPYDWDNIKFLFWFGIVGSAALASLALKFYRAKSLGRVLGIMLIIISVLSGILSYYREVRVRHQLFSAENVAIAEWVKINTDPQAIFLTAPIHNSFVSNLAGRKIVMGYPGLLWVHGIDYQKVESKVKRIYAGDSEAGKLAKELDADFIVVSPYEIDQLNADPDFFDRNFCKVYTSKTYVIYETNQCSL